MKIKFISKILRTLYLTLLINTSIFATETHLNLRKILPSFNTIFADKHCENEAYISYSLCDYNNSSLKTRIINGRKQYIYHKNYIKANIIDATVLLIEYQQECSNLNFKINRKEKLTEDEQKMFSTLDALQSPNQYSFICNNKVRLKRLHKLQDSKIINELKNYEYIPYKKLYNEVKNNIKLFEKVSSIDDQLKLDIYQQILDKKQTKYYTNKKNDNILELVYAYYIKKLYSHDQSFT